MTTTGSKDEIRELAHRVHKLLTIYVALHDALLGSDARVFKPSDFANHSDRLGEILTSLNQCRTAVWTLAPECQADERAYLATLDDYVVALSESVAMLGSTCTKLAAKARGESYGFWAYRRDLSAYNSSVSRYVAKAGVLINAWAVARL